ncbi:hypothetical protein BE18_36465 [Sorangium cellulosum]|uniref:Uncharacterized protein n=1 Tax=Sorangium cellulosum TaxID=56 RepID=A0A150RAC3_SORCE|nr:hypothetical protein BE18_36465 [Sorangium cellulosum]
MHVDPRLLERAGPLLQRTTVYETVIDPREADARLTLTPDDTALALYDDVIDGTPRDTGTREYIGARIPLKTRGLDACAQRLVEHYATYVRPIRLGRHAIDLSGALKITVLDCNDDIMLRSSNPPFPNLSPISEIDGIPTVRLGDRYCFRVENKSPVVLKVALLECGINGVVIYHGDTVINAGSFHVFWWGEVLGRPSHASPPLGLSRIVAIGTTDRTATFRHLECKATFMDSLDTRLSGTEDQTAPSDRWTGVVSYLDTIISHDLTKGATR